LAKRKEKMSKLVEHAERELKLAGLFDPDSDYAGMLAESVLELVRTHSHQGHSGMSHAMTLQIFNKVVNFEALTPLTNNPEEWQLQEFGPTTHCWQNKRQSSCFSYDGGKTYSDINDKEKIQHFSKEVV
jgi:hypothetical protein